MTACQPATTASRDRSWMCGGNCACTSCHVVVRRGEANLSAMDDYEADRLDLATAVTLHSRLGCQAVVMGDVTVEIP